MTLHLNTFIVSFPPFFDTLRSAYEESKYELSCSHADGRCSGSQWIDWDSGWGPGKPIWYSRKGLSWLSIYDFCPHPPTASWILWTEKISNVSRKQSSMSKRLGVVAMMLLLIASFAVVSASENSAFVKGGGYVIEPGHSTGMNSISPMLISSSITQGRTNWHTKSVSSYITSLNVDLNWGNPSNSLRLKIYSPDGYTFGPYYDSFDGSNNGRINFYINNANGIAKGTWYYEVYGDHVSGTQTYSL